MGKIKRIRQKYHASLKQENEMEIQLPAEVASKQQLMPVIDKTDTAPLQSDNMFAGLQIKFEDVKDVPAAPTEDECDRMSISSSLTATQTGATTKKERRRLRKEAFLKKIDTIKAVEREKREKKKREKTAIVGDVHPLLESLPTLEEILASNSDKKHKATNKTKSTKKQKQATKDMMDDIKMFVAINRDHQYKNDPFGSVKKAVQNRVLYEEELMNKK